MIDQALNVLTLHVIWKARRLPTEVQPSPDDTRLRETFLAQRETLLKRLVEYAVGSQSKTTDGIRRASSTYLAFPLVVRLTSVYTLCTTFRICTFSSSHHRIRERNTCRELRYPWRSTKRSNSAVL